MAHCYFPCIYQKSFSLENVTCHIGGIEFYFQWVVEHKVKGSHIYILRCFASLQSHSLIAKSIGSFVDLNIIFTEPVCLETLQQQQKNKNKKKISLLSSKSESSCFSSHHSQLPTVSFKVFRWDVPVFAIVSGLYKLSIK